MRVSTSGAGVACLERRLRELTRLGSGRRTKLSVCATSTLRGAWLAHANDHLGASGFSALCHLCVKTHVAERPGGTHRRDVFTGLGLRALLDLVVGPKRRGRARGARGAHKTAGGRGCALELGGEVARLAVVARVDHARHILASHQGFVVGDERVSAIVRGVTNNAGLEVDLVCPRAAARHEDAVLALLIVLACDANLDHVLAGWRWTAALDGGIDTERTCFQLRACHTDTRDKRQLPTVEHVGCAQSSIFASAPCEVGVPVTVWAATNWPGRG